MITGETMNHELMFAALNATNEAILRSADSSELYQKVCDAAVHGGHIRITNFLVKFGADRRT